MNPDRWKQVDNLLQSVLERPPEEREAFLRQACAGDEALESEVLSLLRSQQQAGSFLESPAMEVAARELAFQESKCTPETADSLAGQTISHYRVFEKLGEGGMGVVWKARDTRLGRFVALKILPAAKMSDPERKRRFVQEARTASALNHPNIITIYDIDQADGTDFIAMEFVPGKTLDRLIPRKGLRLNEALQYATQVADALVAAHAAGIVHRDLKPGNIMVNESGGVKVLDFGLAKLTERGPATEFPRAGTICEGPKTDDGMIVGTVSYMSPEQAEGKPASERSDVFSFGVVLYEMLAGRRPFPGDSAAAIMAAVLRDNPPPLEGVPAELTALVSHCLRKDAACRFQSMADVKIALEELKEAPNAIPATPPARRRGWRMWLAASALLALAAAGWYRFGGSSSLAPMMKVVPLTSDPGIETWPSFSPDGNQVAFTWNGKLQNNFDIYVKLVSGGDPLRVTQDPAADCCPAWSPDGGQVAFLRRGFAYLVSPLGGPERKFTQASFVAWFPDGKSLLIVDRPASQPRSALYLVSLATTERRQLTFPPPDRGSDAFGAFSPDGKNLAFVRQRGHEGNDIYVQPLARGAPNGAAWRLTSDGSARIFGLAWIGDSREIVFSSERGGRRSLWRIAAAPGAEPRRLPGTEDASYPAIARGPHVRLAYQRAVTDRNIWRMELAAPGEKASPPTPVLNSTEDDFAPQFSPDGKQIVFVSERSGSAEIWVSDWQGSNLKQLTSFGGPHAGVPRWSPDGRRITFSGATGDNMDIFVINVEGGGLRRLTTEPSFDARSSWSRDGRWIYFRSNRSGSDQIWKMPSEGGSAVQITKGGASDAFEAPDGKLLYYSKYWLEPGVWSVPVDGGEETSVIASAFPNLWGIADRGIYFLDLAAAQNGLVPLMLYRFDTRRISQVAALEKVQSTSNPSFSVTRDGRWVVWARYDRSESNLMLIPDFR
jgi:Tol biopolymer transport system component/serine/threonine protein kinase